MLKEFNVSKDFENYSQRNNVLVPNSSCGPTNMIQALEYSHWHWNNSLYPELKQPEDKLTKFCRTNEEVLNYYATHYKAMYENWLNEAGNLAKQQHKKYWEVDCKNSYPPNEVHDVMNYATNLFIGYSAEDLKNMKLRPVTNFVNQFKESTVVSSILSGVPVVSSVKFNGYGHYVTIVGFTADIPEDFDENNICLLKIEDSIKEYIIDNTYGRFNFKTNKYDAVSGNDEHIEKTKFLSMVKPVMHTFTKGAATVC